MITCTGAIRRTRTILLNEEVGWEPLKIRRENRCLIMYYKMVKGLVPSYLSQLVPRQLHQTVTYNLRNRDRLQVPFARTVRFFNYFTVCTARRWNDLDAEIRNMPTLTQFKNALKRLSGYRTNKLYLIGLPQTHVYHTRLRLGLSGLAGHLQQYHIIEDGTCNFCYLEIEDSEHYILHCPFFNIQRIHLLANLAEIIPLRVIINIK
jgi:hypothetical protein